MQQEIPAAVFSTWQSARKQAARIPAKVWLILWAFLIAAVFTAFHTALSDKSASLRLKVQHSFRSAQIAVFVDGELAYSGKLTGSPRKKFGLIPDSIQGTLSQVVSLSSGKHVIRVQVTSSDGSVQEDSTSSDFARNSERILSVSARRGIVFATWQGDNSLVTEAASTPSWIGRYASTLFLTMAGSIISALTGFALRELPGQIRARQAGAAKTESVAAGR
jgi:hypothetical protein